MIRETGYAPAGMVAWDFWLLEAGGRFHLFHLQAPRNLHPELRHFRATIGHAVSDDLCAWQDRGSVLGPGPRGAWDDRCIWTGSIAAWRGRFWFLYTALQRGHGLVQRIGLAVSDDLERFVKHPGNPVLCADPRWYQTRRPGFPWEDWRDPWLCVQDGRLTALICARLAAAEASTLRLGLEQLRELTRLAAGPRRARLASGPLTGRGCIALAHSADGLRWQVAPPLFAPGRYDMLECPQLLTLPEQQLLLFSSQRGWIGRRWPQAGQTGAHAWWRPAADSPWRPVNGHGAVPVGGGYGTRLVRRQGGWQALSWLSEAAGEPGFCGRIARPVPMSLGPGSLALTQSSASSCTRR